MFQVAVGKLPADCLVYYLPFSLMKVVRKICSIDKSGLKIIFFEYEPIFIKI
ncbi:MAG: hypothetical protein GYA35_05750 [Thermoanaerobaculaceae bacterium]|nr:hypothetical protein [Thermoanaerobaculaceae bacterium]